MEAFLRETSASSSTPLVKISKNKTKSNSIKNQINNNPITSQINEEQFSSRYLDSSVVDTRPAPATDWKIDSKALQNKSFRGVTVQYTVWVSETGVIDHLVFLNSESVPTEVLNALLSLKDTIMAPATIRDIPVPCVLNLELSFGY